MWRAVGLEEPNAKGKGREHCEGGGSAAEGEVDIIDAGEFSDSVGRECEGLCQTVIPPAARGEASAAPAPAEVASDDDMDSE